MSDTIRAIQRVIKWNAVFQLVFPEKILMSITDIKQSFAMQIQVTPAHHARLPKPPSCCRTPNPAASNTGPCPIAPHPQPRYPPPRRCQFSDLGVGTRNHLGKHEPPFRMQGTHSPKAFSNGGCARARFGVAGCLEFRYSYPAHSCHPSP